MRRRPRGHVAIHGNFRQIGSEDVRTGLEQDRHQRNRRLQLVWSQVGEQTAHEAAVVCLTDNVVVVLLVYLSARSPWAFPTYFTCRYG